MFFNIIRFPFKLVMLLVLLMVSPLLVIVGIALSKDYNEFKWTLGHIFDDILE